MYVLSETFPGYSHSPYSPQSCSHRRAKATQRMNLKSTPWLLCMQMRSDDAVLMSGEWWPPRWIIYAMHACMPPHSVRMSGVYKTVGRHNATTLALYLSLSLTLSLWWLWPGSEYICAGVIRAIARWTHSEPAERCAHYYGHCLTERTGKYYIHIVHHVLAALFAHSPHPQSAPSQTPPHFLLAPEKHCLRSAIVWICVRCVRNAIRSDESLHCAVCVLRVVAVVVVQSVSLCFAWRTRIMFCTCGYCLLVSRNVYMLYM